MDERLPISILKTKKRRRGFTLAELLIALAILGVIATFTIPKIITAQQNGQAIAVTKEDLSAIGAAYVNYQTTNTVDPTTFTAELLIPSLNYSVQNPATSVDVRAGSLGSANCGTYRCLLMHNGSILFWPSNSLFASQGCAGVGIRIYIDPDGTANATGVTDGPGKTALFCLHANGRLDEGGLPSWFSW